MQIADGVGDHLERCDGHVQRDRPAAQLLFDGRSGDVLHHDARKAIVFDEVVQLRDARVIQRAVKARLVAKAFERNAGAGRFREPLDRDVATKVPVHCPPYHAHSTGTQKAGDSIRTDFSPCRGAGRHEPYLRQRADGPTFINSMPYLIGTANETDTSDVRPAKKMPITRP